MRFIWLDTQEFSTELDVVGSRPAISTTLTHSPICLPAHTNQPAGGIAGRAGGGGSDHSLLLELTHSHRQLTDDRQQPSSFFFSSTDLYPRVLRACVYRLSSSSICHAVTLIMIKSMNPLLLIGFHLISFTLVDALVSDKNGYTVAVVGGGVGGLATAARIAASPDLPPSSQVILLEKNSPDMVGGRCGSFYRNLPNGQFRHERGPSLLLLKDVYLDLFSDCGRDAKDFGLEILQCAPAYQVVFEDGDSIQLGFPKNSDLIKNSDELQTSEMQSRKKMNSFEPNGAVKWDEYMQSTQAFLDCGLPNFIEERLDVLSFPSFLYEALRDGLKVSNKELCI